MNLHNAAVTDFEDRGINYFIPLLRNTFILLADSIKVVFADERLNDAASLEQLQAAVIAARTALRDVFGETFDRPNTHTSSAHLADGADRYAVPKNFDVRTLETNHAGFRRFIARSSNIVVERQMMEWENMKQALHFLANGGDPAAALVPDHILKLLREDPVFQKLLGRAPASNPHGGRETDRTRSHVTWIGSPIDGTVTTSEQAWILPTHLASARMELQVHEFSGVEIPSRPDHLAKICKGDAWECVSSAGSTADLQMPSGPRRGVGIAVVDSIIRDEKDQPWVRVVWFGKKGGLQTTVQCQPYEEKTSARYTRILPVTSLQRRAHFVQHGVHLLLNRFFIK